MHPLIVSFAPGTSGRFISAISYMLRNNINKEFEWTKENSAHNFSDFFTRPYWSSVPSSIRLDTDFFQSRFNNSAGVYKYLDLKPWHIMPTHAYPNFSLIKEKAPTCKVILIVWDHLDINEILYNDITKNSIEMTAEAFIRMRKDFLNAEIPDDFKNQTLVITYSDIYKMHNNSYITLEKISQFLNTNINKGIVQSYKNYVVARNQNLT